jgi:hypothetical protein
MVTRQLLEARSPALDEAFVRRIVNVCRIQPVGFWRRNQTNVPNDSWTVCCGFKFYRHTEADFQRKETAYTDQAT